MKRRAVTFLVALVMFFPLCAGAETPIQDLGAFTYDHATLLSASAISPGQVLQYRMDEDTEAVVQEYVDVLQNTLGWTVLDRWEGDNGVVFALRSQEEAAGFQATLDGHTVKGCHLMLLVQKTGVTFYLDASCTTSDLGLRTGVIAAPSPTPCPTPAPTDVPANTEGTGSTGHWAYHWVTRTVRCPSCYGSGRCPTCHGMGYISMYGNKVSCDRQCTSCGGAGSFTQEVYERYWVSD